MPQSNSTLLIVTLASAFILYWTTKNMPAEINSNWFQSLKKPEWYPSNRLFGPVWTVLYSILAYVGYQLYQSGDLDDDVILQDKSIGQAFVYQLLLNVAWTPVFFMWHNPALALGVILLLDYMVYTLIIRLAIQGRAESQLLYPYAAWIAFATALNASIWWMNRSV